jgi:hypothetical protein
MGVTDGQPVSAAVTNPAFLDANADDTALGKINLNNIADPTVSGSVVNNIQRELNGNASFTGQTTNSPKDRLPTWTNNDVGSASDNLKTRADYLTEKFNVGTGHNHDGTTGSGAPISGSSIVGVPYTGYVNQGVSLTGVTGTSTDVSTELTGKAPSTSSTVLGVVVNTPFNKAILRYASGVNTGDPIVDGLGNLVYGRVTESAGVWTLSYYVMLAGVETAYSFSSTDVDWYYQELYDTLVSTPVYSELAVTPSDNTTSEVVDATESLAGKVILANTAPPAVASASVKGTSTRVAHQDHTHEGVHSLGIDGLLTQLLGDVQLKAGTNITLSFDSGKIKIDMSGTLNVPHPEYRTITVGEAAAMQLTLANTPNDPTKVMLDFIGGTSQEYGVDYSVTGNVLTWNGYALQSVLDTGDRIRILYWT